MATQMHRPSAPEVTRLLASVHGLVIAATGHRPDKLGGYGQAGQDRDVTRFSGTGFSNFAPCKVTLDGLLFPTVEAAYQAAKTLDPAERRTILACQTPADAKKLGKKLTLRPDWDAVKAEVMQTLLEQKFRQPKYRELLLSTGQGRLEEGNTWGDTYWGTVNGVGENKLGLLLMGIRSRLAAETHDTRDPLEVLVELAEEYLRKLKPTLVITGMALGWDTAVALACVRLGIPFLSALPFPKQASRWPEKDQQRHAFLLKKAALVVAVGSDELADADIRAAMQWRNEFMVDNVQLVLACFDGSAGGTANCVRDAQEQGKTIVNTYSRWCEMTGNMQVSAPATPGRSDGIELQQDGCTFTAYPVDGTSFYLAEGDQGSVLVHKDTLAPKHHVQANATVMSEFLYSEWCRKYGHTEEDRPITVTHAGEELKAYPVGNFLAARQAGNVILVRQN